MAWEYKVLVLPSSKYDVDEEILNIHGEKGWELTSVILDEAGYRVCYFKRSPHAQIGGGDVGEKTSF